MEELPKFDLYRDICFFVVLCLCTILIYVHLFGPDVLTQTVTYTFDGRAALGRLVGSTALWCSAWLPLLNPNLLHPRHAVERDVSSGLSQMEGLHLLFINFKSYKSLLTGDYNICSLGEAMQDHFNHLYIQSNSATKVIVFSCSAVVRAFGEVRKKTLVISKEKMAICTLQLYNRTV